MKFEGFSERDIRIFFYGLEWIAKAIRSYPAPNMDALADDILIVVSEAYKESGLDRQWHT